MLPHIGEVVHSRRCDAGLGKTGQRVVVRKQEEAVTDNRLGFFNVGNAGRVGREALIGCEIAVREDDLGHPLPLAVILDGDEDGPAAREREGSVGSDRVMTSAGARRLAAAVYCRIERP